MKFRLSFFYFLQFAVWGCYLSSLGQFLGASGLGRDIAWFYAAIGLVSILTPALMGHIADRMYKPARLLGLCHVAASFFMLASWFYSLESPQLSFSIFYPLYLGFLAFYMPTMALANTVAFGIIKARGNEPVDLFPSIRVWGTVGFIIAMWMVNSVYWHDGNFGITFSDSHPFSSYRFQYTSNQLLCAGVFGLIAALFTLVLPSVTNTGKSKSGGKLLGLFRVNVFNDFFLKPRESRNGYFSFSKIGIFLVFAAFIGVCMQISNGFATPFISHFMGMAEYRNSFAAGNATLLFSLSQISEAFFLLFVGKSLKKWGIGIVFGLGILAWSFRFLFFGMGNPDDGVIFLILSMIIYGIAFNFITIAGHLHIERVSPEHRKGLGQGMMMFMSNGVGATFGTLLAGEVVNHWCQWEMIPVADGQPMRLFMGDWQTPWFIFGGYALVLLFFWIFCFVKGRETKNRLCPSE